MPSPEETLADKEAKITDEETAIDKLDNRPLIKQISIIGLQGEKDVNIRFTSNVTILIADNGIGKTTILGIIYAVLSGNLYRLNRIEFAAIKIIFNDSNEIEIPQEAIQPSLFLSRADPKIRRMFNQFPESLVQQIFEETIGIGFMEFRRHPIVREMLDVTGMPPRYLYDILREANMQAKARHSATTLFPEPVDIPNLDGIRESLQNSFPPSVLYFPTYRRIEEDLETLGFVRKEGSRAEALIQFGMNDVNRHIRNITDQIKNSSVAWYAKINGQILSQFVDGIKVDDSTRRSIEDKAALKIVLDRIGENISSTHKNLIIQLVEQDEIKDSRYDSLVYFLSNLIEIYDQQRELDNSIKEFTRVCNKYLVDKEVIYNESAVEIGIYQKRNKKTIELSKLSSGEKQIISLFSRLYLDSGQEPLALLFDEPELSLSIDWQRMLLPDIVRTGKCKFLLATTHSPFVFENEFDLHARDLREFITYL